MSCPNELLLDILELSVLYHSTFNHSTGLGSNSIWDRILRHKKSIVLVSKRWNRLATPLPYRQVFLRRASQLQPLMNTLSNSTLGSLIQELTFTERFTVEFDKNVDVYDSEDLDSSQISSVRMLPHLCPNLQYLSARTNITHGALTYILSEPTLFRITEIECRESLNDTSDFWLDPWIFQACGRLRRLSISGLAFERLKIAIQEKGIEILEFPVLEDLQIAEDFYSFPSNWFLPRLAKLSIMHAPTRWSNHSVVPKALLEQISVFLERNGSQVQYLALLAYQLTGTSSIETILSYCPKLDHLVVDELRCIPSEPQHSEISSIDVYTPVREWPSVDEVISRVANYPSIQLFRYVVGGCRDFQNILSTFPVSHDVDLVTIFNEACIWLGWSVVKTRTYSAIRSPSSSEFLVQILGFLPSDTDSSDDSSDYTPSILGSDEETESSEGGEDEE